MWPESTDIALFCTAEIPREKKTIDIRKQMLMFVATGVWPRDTYTDQTWYLWFKGGASKQQATW